jgi:hypothetical protein
MIIKIQVPLSGPGEALIYDQTRRNMCTVPITSELRRLMAGAPMIYCEAELENGYFIIGKKTAEQDW